MDIKIKSAVIRLGGSTVQSFIHLVAVTGVAMLSLLSGHVAAEESDITTTERQSKMEAGLLLVGQVSGDYRGSSHVSSRFLPLPYFTYQGPVVQVDRGGIRGDLWKAYRFQLNVSVDGSLGSNNSQSSLRQGMPELDSAVEFGPSLDIQLSGESLENGWSLRLPLRGVFTLSKSGVEHIGYLANPRFTWRNPNLFASWRFSFHAGALFADREYHNYYYGVAPQFANAQRSVYQAVGGYSGSYLRFNFYRGWETWRYGLSLRYDYLAGSKFAESPLYETDHYGSISFAILKKFWGNTGHLE